MAPSQPDAGNSSRLKAQLSNEKRAPGWLGYIGDD